MKYNPVNQNDVDTFFPDGISASHLAILTMIAYEKFSVEWGFYNLFARAVTLRKRFPYYAYGLTTDDMEFIHWLQDRLNEWADTLGNEGMHELTYGRASLNVE